MCDGWTEMPVRVILFGQARDDCVAAHAASGVDVCLVAEQLATRVEGARQVAGALWT